MSTGDINVATDNCSELRNFNGKYTAYLSNADKSGDGKTFVVTIVANVAATEIMLLDTTVLNNGTFHL